MCHSPQNEPEISKICTGQRRGYDICPASELGRELLYEAYTPLFQGGIDYAQDTLHYRLGYSFSIGDLMTLVLCPNGKLMTHWGTRDFEHCPDMETTLAFIKNLMSFSRGDARKYLYAGKMKNCSDIECEEIAIPLERGKGFAKLPRLLSSCWEAEDGKTAYIVVNPDTAPAHFYIDKIEYEVEPLNARLVIR